MEEIRRGYAGLRLWTNTHYASYQPFDVVVEVVVAITVLYLLRKLFSYEFEDIKKALFNSIFTLIKQIPQAKARIQKEKQGVKDKMSKELAVPGEKYYQIPEKPIKRDQLLKTLREYASSDDAHWKKGKISGGIYCRDEDIRKIVNEAYSLFSYANPLHPDVFPSVRKFEIEVIRMTADMMNGDAEVCGIITSGGTESILMACKTYRDRAGIAHPEMIVPVTAHAAFDKAAQYFGIKIRHAPVDPKTHLAIPYEVKRLINSNTIMIVGSAPQFPHGVVDPIKDLAKIAMDHGIGFHTDACLGGFLLPWLRRLGDKYGVPPFDFSVPGVTSMSVDTHKYGLTNKGSSVLLFKNEDLRRNMYFCITDWPGGVYASPGMAGSRPGGVIASAWAALLTVGQDGYKDYARRIWETAQAIKKGVKENPHLKLEGDAFTSIVAFSSPKLDIYKVSDAMKRKGWHLNALQRPSSIHICITGNSMGCQDEFMRDLNDSVKMVIENPKGFPDGTAPIYGMTASLPDRSLVADIALTFLDAVIATSGESNASNEKQLAKH